MGLKDFVSGIKLTVPIETLQKAIAGTFKGAGVVEIKRGAKYALAGEWWRVAGITERSLMLEPIDPATKVKEVGA